LEYKSASDKGLFRILKQSNLQQRLHVRINFIETIQMGKLDGKIALITGGSEGIGFATAQQFIIEGAEHVFITGRRQQALDEAVQKINSKNLSAIQADASNLADLDKLYSIIKEQKGRLDILFANAGVTNVSLLESVTEKDFDDTFNVNVKGVLFTVQKALPIFTDGGSIILNGSVTSIKGNLGRSVYSATKAAVRSFARCWTVDLKERRIRVNTVSPGPIDTPLLRSLPNYETRAVELKAATTMNRIGTPDELAKVVVFLASDDSSYITGIELFVDGGLAQI
jgi:NAD(P)-dependent dehydrogenase (short-subunit alcohol dehydrogenase family)